MEGFKKRNEHKIVTKKGAKYELDRDKWTTYANFSDMYNHIYEEMEDAKVATPYAAPMWQDCDGNPCLEKDAFGCKVTHNLTHPEMCVVMDEPPDTQSRYAVETYRMGGKGAYACGGGGGDGGGRSGGCIKEGGFDDRAAK